MTAAKPNSAIYDYIFRERAPHRRHRQDCAQEAKRIVEPVLKAGLPVHQYAHKTWGPKEADQAVVPPGGWHNPVVTRNSGEEISS